MIIIYIYHYFGHLLILFNLISIALDVFPSLRKVKFDLIEKNGYKLWHEQLVTCAEIAIGIALIRL